jgi:hypothetical protein
LAGLKGYVTNLPEPTPEFVMAAYHQLWQVEKSFRMSKTDLRARPIYHHKRDSIEENLTIVMAASRGAGARTPDRLVDQKARPDPTALPQHRRPDRQPHSARRHTTRRPSLSHHHRCQGHRQWTPI